MSCGLTEAEIPLQGPYTRTFDSGINAWNWKDIVKYERRSLENLPASLRNVK